MQKIKKALQELTEALEKDERVEYIIVNLKVKVRPKGSKKTKK